MALDFESLKGTSTELAELPEYEAHWIKSRIEGVMKTLEEKDDLPDILFDGRPYDEKTAHLRLLQLHQDSIRSSFSEASRLALFEAAAEFALAAELPDDIVQANWLKASQEER